MMAGKTNLALFSRPEYSYWCCIGFKIGTELLITSLQIIYKGSQFYLSLPQVTADNRNTTAFLSNEELHISTADSGFPFFFLRSLVDIILLL
jgi:hypothetical protein